MANESVAGSLPDLEFSVLELADRLLSRGVVLVGEATISVAGVDLIYLGLNVVLTGVENLQSSRVAGHESGVEASDLTDSTPRLSDSQPATLDS